MKSEKRNNTSRSVDGKRTDRVKKPEIKKMLKLREKDKSIEQIAGQLKRSTRTVSKHLEKANASPQQNERMFDPLVIEARKKHIADMAAIAGELLANGLDTAIRQTNISGTDKIIYSTSVGDSTNIFSHEQLADKLRVNWGLKWVRMNTEDKTRFLTHLKAEIKFQDIPTIISENPYELIEALRVLVRRGTLKGQCDICQQL